MKKLKTEWTEEMAQALKNYHSIDYVSELEAMLVDQLAMSINKDIVTSLMQSDIQNWWDTWSGKTAFNLSDMRPAGRVTCTKPTSDSSELPKDMGLKPYARLIPAEDVQVVPLGKPSGFLHYIDYTFKADTFTENNMMYLLLG